MCDMTPKTLGRVTMLAKVLSVVLVVHFQSKASSIYKQLRQCVSESADSKMAELCQNYPESIDFYLNMMLGTFIATLLFYYLIDRIEAKYVLRK